MSVKVLLSQLDGAVFSEAEADMDITRYPANNRLVISLSNDVGVAAIGINLRDLGSLLSKIGCKLLVIGDGG